MIQQEHETRHPPPLPFDFAEKPARFERIRLAIARDIFCRRTYILRLSLWLVPRDHPWNLVTQSTLDDWREMTYATLRPRVDGQVQPELNKPINGHKGFTALWVVIIGLVAYSVLDTLSRMIPGPAGDLTGLDERIRIFERIGDLFG